jgi:hypothetical protein
MAHDPMVELLGLLEKRKANRNEGGESIAGAVQIERDITNRCDAVLRSMVRPAIHTILALHPHTPANSVLHSSAVPQAL